MSIVAIRESREPMIRTSTRKAAERINSGLLLVHSLIAVLIFVCTPPSRAQSGQGARWDHDVAKVSESDVSVANVKVSVEASKVRNIVGYRAFGINTSVYDPSLINPQAVSLLNAAAINTLRYPGGAYADTYHWSNYKPTPWQSEKTPKNSDYEPNDNFGNFARLLD